MIPEFMKMFFVLILIIRKYFTGFKISILILIWTGLFMASGCEGLKTTESIEDNKTSNYDDTVLIDKILKENILREDKIPLSYFFLSSKMTDSTFKALKNYRLMVFDLSSDNPSLPGLVFEPEAVSIEAIKIVGDLAYLSDAVYGNIKKICLQGGSLISSKSLEKNRFEFYLQEIAFFNGLLYVITHRNKVFRLTLDLEYLDSFFMPDSHHNNNYVYSDCGKKLIVFSDGSNDFIIDEKTKPSEYIVDEKTKIFQRRLHIDGQLNFSYDTLSFKNHSEYQAWITTLRGDKIDFDGKPFYLCNGLNYEVPEDFPEGEFFRGIFG